MKKILLLILSVLFFLEGYTQTPNSWTQKANFNADPVGWERAYAVGFSINGKGYIGTGTGYLNDFWEYDPINDVWTQKANVGGMGRRDAVGFSINGKGYIGTGFGYNGSFSFLNDFWEYDPVTNVWAQKANFGGAARSSAVGFSINGKGYIGTGYNGSYFKDFWEYDPTTNLWSQKPDFPGTARDQAVGFSINGKGYLGTGGDASFNYTDFWQYDPDANSWVQKANFAGYSRAAAVGFSTSSKGYIGTGYVVPLGSSKDFWEYDPTTNLWTQKADFGGTARNGAVGFSINGKGYIGTGSYKDFWEYTPVPDNTITIPPFTPIPFCQTSGFVIAYTATGQYNSGNIFTAQLSDADGSFANPISIGTTASTSSGTIQCDFNYPPPGIHYRIRVIASNPATIGSDNGIDLEIKENHIYYRDVDGDGFGNPNQYIENCIQISGYVTDNTDCNDNDASVHSGITYYRDADGDGFGDPNNSTTVCSSTPPTG
ncbi:MAG: hypothetical protein JST17_12985, partial [Bacteroidetes bacterium]|nr:hypothetical protein [Bacteroidota bacterium]